MRQLLQSAVAAAIREWWLTNTVAWAGIIAIAIWIGGWI